MIFVDKTVYPVRYHSLVFIMFNNVLVADLDNFFPESVRLLGLKYQSVSSFNVRKYRYRVGRSWKTITKTIHL
jgi:hypothetical protein